MHHKEAYIFIGPPGSGKGSLSKLCIEHFGWAQLSTGNLCRKHIIEETEIGKQIDFTIKSGKLISDDLITQLVDEWLGQMVQEGRTVILDGFPRNALQVNNLFALLKEKYASLKVKVVRFLISDETAVHRICSRYVCQNKHCQAVYSANAASGLTSKEDMKCDGCGNLLGRRDDDAVETVINRLKVYRDFEEDMLATLNKVQGNMIDVHVERPLHEIFDTFKKRNC
jgi:adenylate kinase